MRFFFLSLFCIASWALAWSDHGLLTHVAVQDLVPEDQRVTVESIETFLDATEKDLVVFLPRLEAELKSKFKQWPALPQELIYRPELSDNKKRSFLRALRVQSDFPLALFLQQMPDRIYAGYSPLPDSEVTTLAKTPSTYILPFLALREGRELSAHAVLTTASDEPDYGMDINLWENSPGEDGLVYKLGKQPFGNPNYIGSTQGPFHMGFFYESKLVTTIQPNFKISFAPVRAWQYAQLSKFAFQRGHTYWGYRFLGWALHYIQDIAQPYHASMTPGTGTFRTFILGALGAVRISGPADKKLYEVTNLHFVLEDYQCRRIGRDLENDKTESPLVQALRNTQNDPKYPEFSQDYLVQVVAKESFSYGKRLYKDLKSFVPKSVIENPHPPGDDQNFLELVEQQPEAVQKSFESTVRELLKNVGAHTRNVTRTIQKSQAIELK